MAGLVYAAVKKDFFPLLWAVPSLLVFAIQDFSRIYFFIPLFPAFCISAASMIQGLSDRIGRNKKRVRQLLPIATISIIAIFGLIGHNLARNGKPQFYLFCSIWLYYSKPPWLHCRQGQ